MLKMQTIVVALLFITAAALDYLFGMNTTDVAVVMAGADPSTIVIGVVVVGGVAYWWFADGHVEKIDKDKKK